MPLPIRVVALLTACLWIWMVTQAPASAPLWHPVGFDWVAVLACVLPAPMVFLIACVPYSKLV